MQNLLVDEQALSWNPRWFNLILGMKKPGFLEAWRFRVSESVTINFGSPL